MTIGPFRPAFFRVAVAVAASLAVGAGGCAKEQTAPAPVVQKAIPAETAKEAEAAQPAAAAEAKAPDVPVYSPAGRRDPFVPFLRVEKKEVRPEVAGLPPLQRYELGELRFVGVIWGSEAARALLEDSEGKGYTVTVGSKIGRDGGVVARITDSEIVVKEQFRDYAGAKVERESSLKLQTGGGR